MSDVWWARRPMWPTVLTQGPVRVRSMRRRDVHAWRVLRERNLDWLLPWEATLPGIEQMSAASMARAYVREARAGRMLPFLIEYDERLVGQVTVSNLSWGAMRSAHVGYWIDEQVAGRSITPTAVALVVDFCIFNLGLHRVELVIRPENTASLRVAQKLGFRPEGHRARYLHIDGDWRDHTSFALTVEDIPQGLLDRWRQYRRPM